MSSPKSVFTNRKRHPQDSHSSKARTENVAIPDSKCAEVILICNSLDAGGIERVVSTLANTWSRMGRKVCVITLHDRRRFYSLDPAVFHIIVDRAGVTWFAELFKKLKAGLEELRQAKPWVTAILGGTFYHLLSENLYRFNFNLLLGYEAFLLRRAVRRVESPVVVSFGTSSNIIALKACAPLGRRVIISERTDPKRLQRLEIWGRLSRRFYRNAHKVTANTRSGVESMCSFVEPHKLAFVPNPLAPTNHNGGLEAQPVDSLVFLTIGRLVWDKAHDVLLDAFAKTADELKQWRLAIVGDGRDGQTLRAQAEKLGIAGRVDWHGVVGDPHQLYRTATIFVLPSRVEGMPNVLLEAMSYGLPVIVSDGPPGPLELVEDGVTGLVFPVNQPTALAQALMRLANDEQLRKRLGAAAKSRVAEFELPQALAQWESVIGLQPSTTHSISLPGELAQNCEYS
jgi:glycosyltransferase involved in cell wall biosynthesis